MNTEHTTLIIPIKMGFDHLPHALSQACFRLEHHENYKMVVFISL